MANMTVEFSITDLKSMTMEKSINLLQTIPFCSERGTKGKRKSGFQH